MYFYFSSGRQSDTNISVKYNALDACVQAFKFKIYSFSNKSEMYEALFLTDSIDIVSTFYRKNLPLNVYTP